MTTHQSVLRFGVAGAGVMGRNHARVLADIRDVELTHVFDPDAATNALCVVTNGSHVAANE